MYTIDIGGRKLRFADGTISFGTQSLSIQEVEGLTVIRSDTYVNGAWVNGTRVIFIRGTSETLGIDCRQAMPNRDELEGSFRKVFEPIWSWVGSLLVSRFLDKLANDETIGVGSVRVDRVGVWVDGSWKFLWLKAKPKHVPWVDLRIFSNEGTLYLQSIKDQRYRSEINFNNTENALVLESTIRFLFRDNNWRNLESSFSKKST
jgi:hypothetical protein